MATIEAVSTIKAANIANISECLQVSMVLFGGDTMLYKESTGGDETRMPIRYLLK